MSTEDAIATESASTAKALPNCGDVSAWTLICFLGGSSDAIRSVAYARHGWLLGALLVLSAGLAREYDRSDLMAEPFHLAIPFAASLATSLLLYLIVQCLASWRGVSYKQFLQCYWATAPLAWLYALPVERWFDAASAVHANYRLLEIVAIWRVILMIRVVSTLFGAGLFLSSATVMAYGDFVLIMALQFSPVPVLDLMAGNLLSPADRALQEEYLLILALAWLSIPVWVIGFLVAVFTSKWRSVAKPDHSISIDVTKSGWATALAATAVGIVLSSIEQPPLQNVTAVKRQLADRSYQAALDFLSRRHRSDFPPHWDVPPSVTHQPLNDEPRQLALFFLASQNSDKVAQWVREDLESKVIRAVPLLVVGRRMTENLSDDELAALVQAIEASDESGAQFPHLRYLFFEPSENVERAVLLRRLQAVYEKH